MLHPAPASKTYKDKWKASMPLSGSDNHLASLLGPVKYPGRLGKPRTLWQRYGSGLAMLALLASLLFWWHMGLGPSKHCPSCECVYPPSTGPHTRLEESRDTLVDFKHRGPHCNISSLDLHRPFGLTCEDKDSTLKAMSSGGRIGKDSPYMPLGCDMEWFDTKQICQILGRYSQVVLVGDSMLRHVIGAINILIREDLGYGGVTDWNFSNQEREQCFCHNQFDVRDCSVQGIFSTADVLQNDPLSVKCPSLVPGWSTDLRIEQMVRYPIPEVERMRLEKSISTRSGKPHAFVLGHGLWNNLDVEQSRAWLDSVLSTVQARLGDRAGWGGRHGGGSSTRGNLPILLMTPNAAGERKPDEWIISQGNKALMRFEKAMGTEAAKRHIDHLGTWNMSIQATLYDGVHMDVRGNLLKGMMVMNWLKLIEV